MMETVLTPVIHKLIELLVEEAKSFKGVHREVKSLKDELEIIQCFLRDAEARLVTGDMSEGVKAWTRQVKEEADRIEYVVDAYICDVAERGHHRGCVGFLRKTGQPLKALKPYNNLASDIQNVRESLCEIKNRGERYGLKPLEQGSSSRNTNAGVHDPRLGSLFIEEDELVGIELTRDELMRRLIEGGSTRTVISLVGEGGIGKTTLAKKIYDNELMKGHFSRRAWITVSQSYNMEKLLRIMVKRICQMDPYGAEETNTMEELLDHLRQYLEAKRYVIFFDDVWDMDFWSVMKHALPHNSKGSRIIITTRNDAIAASCKESSCDLIHKLQPLSQELALKLFCKKTFRFEFEGHCPKELEKVSIEIVRKCQGLPLVIAAVAGLLSTKEKVEFEFQKLLNSLSSEFENNPYLTNVSNILSLSYHDLPYHLKSCFLCFGIFPEGYLVFDDNFCRLWIAEGFIQEQRDKTMEQTAQEYLNELVNRNLVSMEEFGGIDKLCRVHDLTHEVILSKVDELGFCQQLDKRKFTKGKSRRLSVYGSTKNIMEALKNSEIRSIFIFNIDEKMNRSFVVTLLEKFRLLKVLEFTDAPIDTLPKQVGNLFHLKYLCLRNTNVKVLPKSIGKLRNLQSLNLRGTPIRELPIEINKLRNLRHLLAFTCEEKNVHSLNAYRGVRIHEGVGCLEELQTLMFVDAHFSGVGLIKELVKLKQLRMLVISKLTAEVGKTLCTAIEQMNMLEFLHLVSASEDEILDLQTISHPPCFLQCLVLEGPLEKLPDWISKLRSLRTLGLYFSKLTDDPLRRLHCLHSLRHLHLYQAYDGEELHVEEGGFPKLKLFEIRKLNGLTWLRIDDGALPLLEKMRFGPSPLVKEVPNDIKKLRNLKLLHFYDMPKEFVLKLQPLIIGGGSGQDYHKVQHIPSVLFGYSVGQWTHDTYNLGDPDFLEHLQV